MTHHARRLLSAFQDAVHPASATGQPGRSVNALSGFPLDLDRLEVPHLNNDRTAAVPEDAPRGLEVLASQAAQHAQQPQGGGRSLPESLRLQRTVSIADLFDFGDGSWAGFPLAAAAPSPFPPLLLRASSFPRPPPGPPPLARGAIDVLPTFSYAEHPQPPQAASLAPLPVSCFPERVIPGTRCAVCQCDYEPGETLRYLPCSPGGALHAFHRDCIDPWLELHATCPVCRARVSPAVPAASAGAVGAVAAAAAAAAPPPQMLPVGREAPSLSLEAPFARLRRPRRRHAALGQEAVTGPVRIRVAAAAEPPRARGSVRAARARSPSPEHHLRPWSPWLDADDVNARLPDEFVLRLVAMIDDPRFPVRWRRLKGWPVSAYCIRSTLPRSAIGHTLDARFAAVRD